MFDVGHVGQLEKHVWIEACRAEGAHPFHRFDNTGEEPAFLRCRWCGLEHTIGRLIGQPGNATGSTGGYWWRMGGLAWRKYPRPLCGTAIVVSVPSADAKAAEVVE